MSRFAYALLVTTFVTPFALAASLLVAGLFHTWEVGHNVFKAW